MTNSSVSQQHLILLEYPTDGKQPSPEEMVAIMARFAAWMDGLKREGRVAATHGLELTGKMLRGPIGETVITDGPFAEGKEVIGGYVLLNACTLDEALAAARACPGLDHRMILEVRPVVPAEHCVAG